MDSTKGLQQASADFYRDLAANYEQEVARFVPGYETMISTIWSAIYRTNVSEAPVIVDLGCGPGHVAEWFLTFAYPRKLYLVDAEFQMLKAAKKRFESLYPEDQEKLIFRKEDVQTFAPDEPADAVYSSLVLHNLPIGEKAAVLKKIHGYLKDGGIFVWADLIVLNNPDHQHASVETRKRHALCHGADPALVERNFRKEAEDDHPLTTSGMKKLLMETGFVNIEKLYDATTFLCLSAQKGKP